MFVVCIDHLEDAIDQFIDEYEEAPDVYKLKDVRFTAWENPAHCEYCQQYPTYLVV